MSKAWENRAERASTLQRGVKCKCGKLAVEKWQGRFVCDTCMNPEPDDEYLMRERNYWTRAACTG